LRHLSICLSVPRHRPTETDSNGHVVCENTVRQSVSREVMVDDELGELKLKYEESQKNLQLLKRLAKAGRRRNSTQLEVELNRVVS